MKIHELPWFGKATYVTVTGKVFKRGEAGVIVWDADGKQPLVAVEETCNDVYANTISVAFNDSVFKGDLGKRSDVFELRFKRPGKPDMPVIRAEVHSDDHAYTASFDAGLYFLDLDLKKILALRDIEWGGNYESAYVAQHMADSNADVAAVFDNKGDQGFECNVCEEDVARWVKYCRPDWFATIWPDGIDIPATPNTKPYYEERW